MWLKSTQRCRYSVSLSAGRSVAKMLDSSAAKALDASPNAVQLTNLERTNEIVQVKTEAIK